MAVISRESQSAGRGREGQTQPAGKERGALRHKASNLSLLVSRKAISCSRVRAMESNCLGSNPTSDTYPVILDEKL